MKTTKVLVLLIWVLAGCQPTSRPDLSAIQIELNALKRELEFVRYQTEDLDPRVRLSEQLAMHAIDEKEAPFRLDCLGHTPGIVVTRSTMSRANSSPSSPSVRTSIAFPSPIAEGVPWYPRA